MDDDVKRVIYGTILGFLLVVLSWLGLIYISSCGFSFSCNRAQPLVIRTPVPTLIPVSQQRQDGQTNVTEIKACPVYAADLIGAWVTAGSPETEPFPFTDLNGNPCQGTFANDIQYLFLENQVWFAGQIGCISCHNADLTDRSGGLDLSSFQGIMAGANGKDILGGGKWESSSLHDVLVVQGFIPAGHSPDVDPIPPVFLYAGQTAEETAGATPTATP